MDVLDEFELRAFEHMHCTHCAERTRRYVEAELRAGTITLDEVVDMEIVVHDD